MMSPCCLTWHTWCGFFEMAEINLFIWWMGGGKAFLQLVLFDKLREDQTWILAATWEKPRTWFVSTSGRPSCSMIKVQVKVCLSVKFNLKGIMVSTFVVKLFCCHLQFCYWWKKLGFVVLALVQKLLPQRCVKHIKPAGIFKGSLNCPQARSL